MNGGTGKTFFKYGVKVLQVRNKVKTATTFDKTESMDDKTEPMAVKTKTLFDVFKNNSYLCSQNDENYSVPVGSLSSLIRCTSHWGKAMVMPAAVRAPPVLAV